MAASSAGTSAKLGPFGRSVSVSTAAARLRGCRKSDQDRQAKRYDRCVFHVGVAGLPEFCFHKRSWPGQDPSSHDDGVALRYRMLLTAALRRRCGGAHRGPVTPMSARLREYQPFFQARGATANVLEHAKMMPCATKFSETILGAARQACFMDADARVFLRPWPFSCRRRWGSSPGVRSERRARR